MSLPDVVHGTRRGYNSGCRCDRCKKAVEVYEKTTSVGRDGRRYPKTLTDSLRRLIRNKAAGAVKLAAALSGLSTLGMKPILTSALTGRQPRLMRMGTGASSASGGARTYDDHTGGLIRLFS